MLDPTFINNMKTGPLYRYLLTKPDPAAQALEEQVRTTNLIFRNDIQGLLRVLYLGSEEMRKFAAERINIALDAYYTALIRAPDMFKPYGPEFLLNQGTIFFMLQMDNVKWMVPIDNLLVGLIILGPQQAGKSRAIINLCTEICRLNPNIVITIVDPKDGFKEYASLLGARTIDLGKNSFDLKPPDPVSYKDYILELMPMIADTAGLIYGLEILTDAAKISLEQQKEYITRTGKQTELSLQDIYAAIPLVRDTSSGRRSGYREAAQTALHRILGEKGLFACRRGLTMDIIFSQNTILNARSLTDDMQCRALALKLLYWKFQQCRYKPETNKLKHLLIFDDASRFFGTAGDQFSASSRTSPLGHILALLRATGTGVVVATQLPAYMDPSLTALSRSMLVVVGMGGSKHLKVISDFMSLDEEQTKAITRLSIREAVGFAPGTAYKECVHGWIPFVKNPDQPDISRQQDDYLDDFDIEPWHHLTEIPTQQENLPQLQTETTTTKPKPQEPIFQPVHPALDDLTPQTKTLLWDCIYYPYSSVSARMKRLSIFGRVFDNSKRQACENGLLLESSAGATKYLIAAKTLYDIYNTPCPYKRGISIEHSFYCGLACFLLKKDPQYKSVCPEAPIGKTGQTSDIRTITHGGHLEAWEICLSTTHLLANATKYQNTAFSKIVFLARNYELSTAIKGFIKASGLDPDLMAKIEYMHFSKLLNRQRKWSQY